MEASIFDVETMKREKPRESTNSELDHYGRRNIIDGWGWSQDLTWKTRKGKNHGSPQTLNFIAMVGGILLMGSNVRG